MYTTIIISFVQIDNNKKKYLGTFDTLEEAIRARKNAENERSIILKERLLAIPKTYNANGQCIFKIKDIEVIIDEEIFHDIIQYKWWLKTVTLYEGLMEKSFNYLDTL